MPHSSVVPTTFMAFTVGDAVRDAAGFEGIVRYIGPIVTKPDGSEFVGVEWKDPKRGKNDGSLMSHRYFTTEAGRGSFLRASALRAAGGAASPDSGSQASRHAQVTERMAANKAEFEQRRDARRAKASDGELGTASHDKTRRTWPRPRRVEPRPRS